MAILKRRLLKSNDSGQYDTLHLETSADCVLCQDGESVLTHINNLQNTCTALQNQITASSASGLKFQALGSYIWYSADNEDGTPLLANAKDRCLHTASLGHIPTPNYDILLLRVNMQIRLINPSSSVVSQWAMDMRPSTHTASLSYDISLLQGSVPVSSTCTYNTSFKIPFLRTMYSIESATGSAVLMPYYHFGSMNTGRYDMVKWEHMTDLVIGELNTNAGLKIARAGHIQALLYGANLPNSNI